ncbi:MAG: hypothetical protein ABI882_17285 [Acidobacteriota bacterium]
MLTSVSCRSLRYCLFFTAFLLIVSTSVRAQSADSILKRASKAMGGEKALRAIKSRSVKASVIRSSDGANGSYRATTQRPNLLITTLEVRGFETSAGFNGKSGWGRDSRDGLRTLTGLTSRDFQAEAAYRSSLWLDYKREKSKISLGTLSAASDARTVVLTTSRNAQIKLSFDPTSFLLVREEIRAGEATRIFEYSDFRPVNGVMEPHSIKATLGSEIYEIKVEEVLHNPPTTQLAFDFPRLSNEPLPEIPTLVKEVAANEEKIDRLLENYTYTELVSTRSFDKSGKFTEKENETYERTFYKGNRIRRLIAKNGQPLTTADQAQEDKRLEKRIREIEKKETEKEKKAQKDTDGDGQPDEDGGRRTSIAEVLRASRLLNPRRERFRNRDVIVFDFEPMPGYKPQKASDKLFGKMAGVLWVDATDKQVARVEARLVEAFKIGGGLLASLKEGASFVIEQDRINNEIWLPTRSDISLTVRVMVVKNIDAFQSIDYGNYKRFNVDAEKEKLQAPVVTDKKP